MGKALGFIEITGVVAAMDALDIMCKAADVSLATWERKLGGRLVTLVVEGDVDAVRAKAIERGTITVAPVGTVKHVVPKGFTRFLGKISELTDNGVEVHFFPGNHDLFFNGWVGFKEQVGPSVYWFEVAFPGGKDIYISLDTATGTLGNKQNKWFRSFLEENRKYYRHCIILTHTNFFYTDNSQVTSGNMPIEESFALIDFLGKQDVSLVLQGHDHYREDLTYDNVRYTVLGAINDHMANPEYLKVYVNQDDIRLDWRSISSR